VAGRWPEVILERLCGPNVIAVEGDLLPAERRDMGKQIIVDNLTLGTQLDHSVLMVLISLAESLAGRPPYRPSGTIEPILLTLGLTMTSTVPPGRSRFTSIPRHFVPGYYQPVPPGQKPFGS
jgi:hypothetical protein